MHEVQLLLAQVVVEPLERVQREAPILVVDQLARGTAERVGVHLPVDQLQVPLAVARLSTARPVAVGVGLVKHDGYCEEEEERLPLCDMSMRGMSCLTQKSTR